MKQRAYYFSDGQYSQILRGLYLDLNKSEAFVHLVGCAESGKSALCETLALYMRRKGHDVVYIDYHIESPEMLRAVLAQKFDLPSVNNISRQLEDAMEANFEKPKIIIFDDAHGFSDITLIEIQRLTEIQIGSQRMLNVLLCGDIDLERRLSNKKQLQSLLLHVTRKYLLPPMDRETVGQFFNSYTAKNDCQGLQLSAEALDLFYKSTKGFPGAAAQIAELIVQDSEGKHDHRALSKLELAALINSSEIQQAMPAADAFNVNQLKVVGPIAAVFVIAVLGFIYQLLDRGSDPEIAAESNEAILPAIESPFAEPAVLLAENSGTTDSPASGEVGQGTNQGQVNGNADVAATPFAPSILRPASIFSLDDEESVEVKAEENDEPVSDSALALVTAAELGVTPEVIVDSAVLLQVRNAETVEIGAIPTPPKSGAENLEPEPSGSVDEIEKADFVADGSDFTADERQRADRAVVEEFARQDGSLVAEAAVQATEQAGVILLDNEAELPPVADEKLAVNNLLQAEQGEASIEESPVSPLEGFESIDQLSAEQDLVAQDLVASGGINGRAAAATINQPAANQPAAISSLEATDEELQSVGNFSDDELVRQRVDGWVVAWEQKDLDAYFASYGSSFEPRYESSVGRWRASRTRVIGNAEWIRLNLSEYEIIEQSPESFEVHFWLDYESPTYSDSTKKKLVLKNGSGSWMIAEEINLQVRS